MSLTITTVQRSLPDPPLAGLGLDSWGGIAVDLHRAVPDYHVATGAHDHHLICYCPQGRGRLVQSRDGRRHESVIETGLSIIMPAGMESVWEGDAAMSLRLRFPPRLLTDVENELGRGRSFELANRFSVRDAVIDRLASLLLMELRRPDHPGDRLIVESLFTALAVHLWREHEVSGRGVAQAIRGADEAVRRATRYIHANLEQPLSLLELAAVAGVSRFHFARIFKLAHGVPPARYIQAARIDEARRLMVMASLPLAEIALAVGFADQSHFTRWFTRIMGASPAAWMRDRALRVEEGKGR